jgi:SAM-dependent methyltransferase
MDFYLVLLLVISVWYSIIDTDSVIAAAFVFKIETRQRQSTNIKSSSSTNNDNTIIHVGNLDWTIPVKDVSGMIMGVVLKICGEESTKDDNSNIEVNVAPLPIPKKKRDDGKFHRGSARVSFQTAEEAKIAMKALQQFSDDIICPTSTTAPTTTTTTKDNNNNNNNKELKLKWASVPKMPTKDVTDSKNGSSDTILSPERIQHRKDRAERYARRRRKVATRTDQIIDLILLKLNDNHSNNNDDNIDKDDLIINNISNQTPTLDAPSLDWSSCPEEIDPMLGGKIRMGTQRGERKRVAVETFLTVVQTIILGKEIVDDDDDDDNNNKSINNKNVIADLGCGAGNLSIPLAWWLNKLNFKILGVDINGQALTMLQKRAHNLGIDVETLQADLLTLINDDDLGNYTDGGDGGDTKDIVDVDSNSLVDDKKKNQLHNCAAVVSLHACGAASDLSMSAAVRNDLPFVISPCCIGKISTQRTSSATGHKTGMMPPIQVLSSSERSGAPSAMISYPRSAWLNEAVSFEEYQMLAAAADYGVGGESNKEMEETINEQEVARRRRCKISKKIIEIDRLQWAKENGYYIRLLEIPRIGLFYPKRELLLGAKKGSTAAIRMSQLPTE